MKRLFFIVLAMTATLLVKAQDPKFYIYLCIGQSNMVGNGQITSADSVVSDRFVNLATCDDVDRKMGEWRAATPPLCRRWARLSPADYFGRTMLENLPQDVRVGVIHVGVNGCGIDLFDKYNYKTYVDNIKADWMMNEVKTYALNPRQRLVDMARLAQKEGVIKGILLHQGETDAYNDAWLEKVKKIYEDLLADLDLKAEEVPILAGEVVGEDQHGVCAGANKTISRIHDYIPTGWCISSKGCEVGRDNLHFSGEGCRMLGRRYAYKMLQLMGIKVVDNTQVQEDGSAAEGAFTFDAAIVGNNIVVSTKTPLQQVDVASYSGETLVSVKLKGKKKATVNIAGYSDDRFVVVATSKEGVRLPKQLNR